MEIVNLASKNASMKFRIFAVCIMTGTEIHVLFHCKSQGPIKRICKSSFACCTYCSK